MKTIIITAADEKYASLFLGLVQSLHQWNSPLSDAIGVLDLGLSGVTLQKVHKQVTHVVTPEWDLPVNLSLRTSRPYLRAMTARPFLRKYFPGYDMYVWLDSDTWVQERYAVEWLIIAAKYGSLAIVPEVDRSYVLTANTLDWCKRNLEMAFGKESVSFLETRQVYNAGAFALLADLPHWDSWEHHFRNGVGHNNLFCSDQMALNHAIWVDNLSIHPLPSLCNWCCHLAIPSLHLSTGKFCEPFIPEQPIGLIHLTANTKDVILNINNNGIAIKSNLRFQEASLAIKKTAATELRG